MNHQDFTNTCIFEQFQGLLFSDLSGPLTTQFQFSRFLVSKKCLCYEGKQMICKYSVPIL